MINPNVFLPQRAAHGRMTERWRVPPAVGYVAIRLSESQILRGAKDFRQGLEMSR